MPLAGAVQAIKRSPSGHIKQSTTVTEVQERQGLVAYALKAGAGWPAAREVLAGLLHTWNAGSRSSRSQLGRSAAPPAPAAPPCSTAPTRQSHSSCGQASGVVACAMSRPRARRSLLNMDLRGEWQGCSGVKSGVQRGETRGAAG